MTQAPHSDETLYETIALVRRYGSIGAASEASGINRKTLQGRVRNARKRFPGCLPEGISTAGWATSTEKPRIRVKAPSSVEGAALRGEIGGPPLPPMARPPEGFIVRRNSAQYDASGNLQRQWIESGQGTTDGYEVPPGHVVKGESALLGPNGNVLARWVKTKEDAGGAGLVQALQEAFAEYDGAAPVISAPDECSDDLLTVYPMPDLHLGMLAWGKEVGEDYDVKIATELAIKSLETLVSRSLPSKYAVLLGLGDLFHMDDQRNVTPGSGHQLDADGRWAAVFAAGAQLALRMVEVLAQKHEILELRFLSGNHDINAAMCLTVALSMFYSANERITVNGDPGIAYYRRHGKCLIGATHGHTVKMDRLAGMMAADRPEDWGLSKHRSFFTGHIHTETAREVSGVRVESLQAPAARDAWNAASGYRSGRSLSAITFHAEEGEIGRHRVNITRPV